MIIIRCWLLPLLLALVSPAAMAGSEFFSIWPGHPEAPERPGPPRTPIDREWSVGLNMRGIAANNAAVQKINVRLPDGDRLFVMERFSDLAGFELVGLDDFQIRPDARDEDISYNWTGVAGGEQMTIAVYQGVMSATITGNKGVYSLIRRQGQPVFQQIDVSRISTLEPGGGGKPPRLGKGWHAPLSPVAPMPKLAIDSVDVLVVHTPAALTLAGSVADMNARVAESFLQMDEALRVSGMDGVKVRNVLNGANLSAQVSYNEVPGNTCAGPSADLCRWVGHRIWLRASASAASLRDTYGADIVVMLLADGADGLGPVGAAYVQGPDCGVLEDYENTLGCDVGAAYSAFAFSVVSLAYTTSFQVFTHEIGHQFGMDHQLEAFGNPIAAYPWSYAKIRSDDAVQTVVGGFSLERTLQFSNPNVPFIGSTEASGETFQFNARTGACLAAGMSDFRTPGQLATLYSDGFELRLIPIDGC